MRTIFVFGSNTEGRHGKGAALFALNHFGATYGVAKGRNGDSYAIITKDLNKGIRSVSLSSIKDQLKELHGYTLEHDYDTFIISPIGTGLAGFSVKEIKNLLKEFQWPENVYISSKFL